MKKLLKHSVIERDISFLTAYRNWFDSPQCEEECFWLIHQFELFKSLPKEVDKSLRFLINESSVGIQWKFKGNDSFLKTQFFMEFFRDKIQSIGYQKQLADQRIFETLNRMETIERYYLKPPFKLNEEDKKLQQFGNIILTCSNIGEKDAEFQCLCHFFKDRQYTTAQPINHLLEIILENG
ncbi:MAG: hypothetical protein RLZZ417_2735 [Bacteroidota bacterium]